jgi:hypothetical protein
MNAPQRFHGTELLQLLCDAPNPAEPNLADLVETPHASHGGGDRNRTDDPLLAKQVLSQLSYAPAGPKAQRRTGSQPAPTEWAREDLNLRPHAYQACALTS